MPLPYPEAGAATALSRFSFIGPAALRRLRQNFGSFARAWQASAADLTQAGLAANDAAQFAARRQPDQDKKDAQWLEREGIKTLLPEEDGFPELLRKISDPPAFLHLRGTAPSDAAAVAVVGTRRASPYGMEMARSIAAGLSRAGVVVVSGLALGIDGAAHASALNSGGQTWAFLGSGLNRGSVYPPSHRPLSERIAAQGALWSEFPPGIAGFKHVFAIRNRLIAGATLGTVVVEAAERSGSLLTARAALEYNREVFALPGDVRRETSRGTHELIRQGAELITSAEDILASLGLAGRKTPAAIEDLPEREKRLLQALGRAPRPIDDLAREIGEKAAETAAALSVLEMRGLVKNVGGEWTLGN